MQRKNNNFDNLIVEDTPVLTLNKDHKIYKDFNYKLLDNTLFTILAFQKGLSQHANPLDKSINNHVSVMMAFNHSTCKIERFLVNYGVPVEVEGSPNGISNRKILELNHEYVGETLPFKNKKIRSMYSLNNLKNGVFNAKFFQIFLLNIIIGKIDRREPNYDYSDIRLISKYRDIDEKMLKNSIASEGKKTK